MPATISLSWDIRARGSWYSYKENSKFYQVWFETDSSLGLKYDLVLQHELKGTGMWALGYDRDRTELWNKLQLKFTNPSGIQNNNPLPDKNLTVYPNPVSDKLIIKYSDETISSFGQSKSSVIGHIIDLQGREVAEFSLSKLSGDPGLLISQTDISHLRKGIYFVKIEGIAKKFIKH